VKCLKNQFFVKETLHERLDVSLRERYKYVRGETSFYPSKEKHIKEYTSELVANQKELKGSREGVFCVFLRLFLGRY